MSDLPGTPSADEPSLDAQAVAFAQDCLDLARAGDTERLPGYVDQGLPANLTDHAGNTILMLAAYHGHLDLVRALTERGADPNRVNDRGQTPLVGAAFKGYDEIARVLVEAGADPLLGQPNAVEMAAFFQREEIHALLTQPR